MLTLLEARFFGYTAYFGYPHENAAAIKLLQAHGFRCIEQSWNHSFAFDGSEPAESMPCVERITRQNYDRFRAVYHADPEAYWSCDRIFEALDDWIVYVYNQAGVPAAAMFLSGNNGQFEIFGAAFADGVYHENMLCELLNASLNECRRLRAKFLIYFCREEEKHALQRLGFECIGQYVLYTKTL